MDKRRLRHGLAVAALGVLVAAAVAAILYGVLALATSIYVQGFDL
jgi:hypothetical protein